MISCIRSSYSSGMGSLHIDLVPYPVKLCPMSVQRYRVTTLKCGTDNRDNHSIIMIIREIKYTGNLLTNNHIFQNWGHSANQTQRRPVPEPITIPMTTTVSRHLSMIKEAVFGCNYYKPFLSWRFTCYRCYICYMLFYMLPYTNTGNWNIDHVL